jgi:hypothetical protein
MVGLIFFLLNLASEFSVHTGELATVAQPCGYPVDGQMVVSQFEFLISGRGIRECASKRVREQELRDVGASVRER